MRTLKEKLEKRGEKGFTLVEVIVSFVLLGILAVSAYPVMFNSLQAFKLNKMTTAATLKVQELLDDVRQSPNCDELVTLGALSGNGDPSGQEVEYGWYGDKSSYVGSYFIMSSVPSGCKPGEIAEIRFWALGFSPAGGDGGVKDHVLIDQSIWVLVPPTNGQFDLN